MNNIEDKITVKRTIQIIISFVGLIAAVIGIYTFFFQEKKVALDYEILANTNVFDINADITKLDIIYDGLSLKNKNDNLRIINLRVKNNGSENILKNYYDNHDPLGLSITNGRIIERPELINTSNDYLKKNLQIKFDSTGRVIFNEVILEANQYFTIKLLILHPSNLTPNVISFGKIAGQNGIPLVSLVQQPKDQKSFLEETFYGGVFSQILRALAYTLIVLLLVIAIIFSVSKIIEYRAKHKRIRIVNEFKTNKKYDYNRMDDAIFSRFETEGNELLNSFLELLKDENVLNTKYRRWIDKLKTQEKIMDYETLPDVRKNINERNSGNQWEWDLINHMINDGFTIKDNDTLVINQPMKKSLNQFLIFLREKKYKTRFTDSSVMAA